METVSIKTITPIMASMMLEQTTFTNRKTDPARVLTYARYMENGQWKFNGDTIRINNIHGVVDGRHRLEAIKKSNTSQKCIVVTDIKPDAISWIDVNKPRSAGDVLTMHGAVNATKIASGIALYALYCNNYWAGNSRKSDSYNKAAILSNDAILNEYQSRPEYWEGLKRYAERMYKSFRLLSINEIMGFIAYMEPYVGDDIYEFFNKLCTYKFNASEEKPIYIYVKTMMKNAQSVTKYSTHIKRIFLVKTWNAYRTKKHRSILKTSATDSIPVIITK